MQADGQCGEAHDHRGKGIEGGRSPARTAHEGDTLPGSAAACWGNVEAWATPDGSVRAMR